MSAAGVRIGLRNAGCLDGSGRDWLSQRRLPLAFGGDFGDAGCMDGSEWAPQSWGSDGSAFFGAVRKTLFFWARGPCRLIPSPKRPKRYQAPTLSQKVSGKTTNPLTQLLCYQGVMEAGDGDRTRDDQLGKLALYH